MSIENYATCSTIKWRAVECSSDEVSMCNRVLLKMMHIDMCMCVYQLNRFAIESVL